MGTATRATSDGSETGAGATQTARKGLVPLTSLHEAFPGGTKKLQARSAQRWCSKLSPALKEKHGRSWFVSLEACLPDNRTVEALVKGGPAPARQGGFRLPEQHKAWSDKDRKRFSDTHELLRLFDELRAAYSRLTEEAVAGILEQQYGQWARDRGLSCKLRTIRNYRQRLKSVDDQCDGNVDRRGRPRQTDEERDDKCSPEAWNRFLQIYLHPNRFNIAQAWRHVRAECKANNWRWPSLSTIRIRLRTVPQAVVTYGREGERAFEAKCAPKIKRRYDQLPAGDWWCLDGRKLDVYVRIPDSRTEWRQTRAVVTGVLDVRSRKLVGWDISVTEHADGILRGIQMALRACGAPLDITVDNGKAYRSALKSGWKSRRCEQKEIMENLLKKLDITVHSTLPYHAYAKPIESIWNKLANGFDRWWSSYCGGSPERRPLANSTKGGLRIEDLPTLDQLRAAFEVYLDTYHAEPQSGNGTRGLSPNQVMAQYRGDRRPIDEEVISYLVTREIGRKKVRRDGITHNHVLYGTRNPEVLLLQGQTVIVRMDPSRADYLIVCGLDGVPICYATSDSLEGCTQEQIREIRRIAQKLRRKTKEYQQERDFLKKTTTEQILQIQRQDAVAREAASNQTLPEPGDPKTVQVLQREYVQSLKRLGRPEDAEVYDVFKAMEEEVRQAEMMAQGAPDEDDKDDTLLHYGEQLREQAECGMPPPHSEDDCGDDLGTLAKASRLRDAAQYKERESA